MAGYTSEFYDGISPLPVKGAVLFYHDHLVYFSENESIRERIDYKNIDTINTADKQIRIGCGVKTRKPLLLVINGVEAKTRFFSHYSLSPSVSILKRLPYRFRALGPASKTALIITPVVVISFLIYILLFHSYVLIPVNVDIAIGDRMGRMLEDRFVPVKNNKMEVVVSAIAKKVIPDKTAFSYRVTVIKGDDLNAFALPGGRIYIFEGLVRNAASPYEIAGVIAHEAAHVENRHGLRQMIRITGISYFLHMVMGAGFEEMDTLNTINDLSTLFVFLHYSRGFEKEADLKAVKLLHARNLTVNGLVSFLEKIRENEKMPQVLNYVNSHPPTDIRINYLKSHARNEKFKVRPLTDIPWDLKSITR